MAYDPSTGKDAAKIAGIGAAKCILDFLFALAVPALQVLKAIVLALLSAADVYLRQLKAQLMQLDLISTAEEIAWSIYEAAFNLLKEQLLFPEALGPFRDICPEFYALITDPALALIETSTSGVSVVRERYRSGLSIKDEVEALYAVWTAYKNELIALIDSIDDALYWAKQEAEIAAEAALINSNPSE